MNYIFLDSIDSTNSFLLEADEPEGAVCISLNQTAGRGRSGRQWNAQSGDCLAFSMRLRAMPADKLMGAQIVAGYAVTEALLPYVDVRLKWPNDLVYIGKKLAGMLIETRFTGNSIKKIVFGVGININAVAPIVQDRAIAVKDINPDAGIDIKDLVANIASLLDDKMNLYTSGALDITEEWPLYSANYMKPVSIHINGSKTTVTEAGITANGYMITQAGDIITDGEIGYDFSI